MGKKYEDFSFAKKKLDDFYREGHVENRHVIEEEHMKYFKIRDALDRGENPYGNVIPKGTYSMNTEKQKNDDDYEAAVNEILETFNFDLQQSATEKMVDEQQRMQEILKQTDLQDKANRHRNEAKGKER